MKTDNWFFVDVEAAGTSPVYGTMTEFGVVHYNSSKTYHGQLYESSPDPSNPAIPVVGKQLAIPLEMAIDLTAWLNDMTPDARKIMWSDNPAFDFMWIAGMFDRADRPNPFGYSARRISDLYSGLTGKVKNTQEWKRLRDTRHDHNPVNDAIGNVEAMRKIIRNFELDRP